MTTRPVAEQRRVASAPPGFHAGRAEAFAQAIRLRQGGQPDVERQPLEHDVETRLVDERSRRRRPSGGDVGELPVARHPGEVRELAVRREHPHRLANGVAELDLVSNDEPLPRPVLDRPHTHAADPTTVERTLEDRGHLVHVENSGQTG
jgi:hypothetical protein